MKQEYESKPGALRGCAKAGVFTGVLGTAALFTYRARRPEGWHNYRYHQEYIDTKDGIQWAKEFFAPNVISQAVFAAVVLVIWLVCWKTIQGEHRRYLPLALTFVTFMITMAVLGFAVETFL